jgi:hypothetical protein
MPPSEMCCHLWAPRSLNLILLNARKTPSAFILIISQLNVQKCNAGTDSTRRAVKCLSERLRPMAGLNVCAVYSRPYRMGPGGWNPCASGMG